jgi:hypothetical protein
VRPTGLRYIYSPLGSRFIKDRSGCALRFPTATAVRSCSAQDIKRAIQAGTCSSPASVSYCSSEVEHPDSPHFVRIPNELKLIFADCLDLDDINTLVRTTRALNRLLTTFMYRRAEDLESWNGRPYILQAVGAGNLTAVRRFIEVGTSVNMSDPTELYLPTGLAQLRVGRQYRNGSASDPTWRQHVSRKP